LTVASGLLIFSATTGYRHESIPAGVAAMRELGEADGYDVDATEDVSVFTPRRLARYAAVIFMNTSGTLLDDAGRSALRGYLGGGGGYVGVHLAAGTEYDWPYYGGLVGARFDQHPDVQPATFEIEDGAHPATAHLPRLWKRTDELYNYRANPRPDVHVLMTLDESSYAGGTMGADHPITWCHRYGGGRAFYTGAGHTIESYTEPEVRGLLLGGLRYAAGTVHADDRPEHGYVRLTAGAHAEWRSPEAYRRYSVKFGWRDGGVPTMAWVGVPERADPVDAARSGGVGIRLGEPAATLNRAGDWNTYEISTADGAVEVHLNGALTARIGSGTPTGHLWLGPTGESPAGTGSPAAAAGTGSPAAAEAGDFRDVRIRQFG
jgi:type 1 glutamine amidotransferase